MIMYAISLAKEEVEYILTVIGQRPYSECVNLVNKISAQLAETHRTIKEGEREALKKTLKEEEKKS
jgi:hypothetical protein